MTVPLSVAATVAGFRLPATLSRAVAVPGPAGRFEVLGGLHDGERSTGAVLSVDPATGTVTVTGRLPVAVHDSAGALLADRPTVLGGGNGSEVAAIQQPAGSGGSVVGRLPRPTSDCVAVRTSRGVVLVGGYDGSATLVQVLLLTAPGQVRALGALPVGVRYPAVAVTDTGPAERVLVVGGESGGVATDAVQSIDVATGAVSIVGRLPTPRTQASGLTLGGIVYVAGGASSGTSTARTYGDILRWDPATARFAAAGRLPYPVADAAAVSPDGRTGYLVGGESPARVDTTIALRLGSS